MANYPFTPIEVAWKRPPIDRALLKQCTKRSDLQGLFHSVGILAVLGASGWASYHFFATGQWLLMAVALYVHGGLFAFNPQTHEFSHGTVFRSRWLNEIFKRVFGIVHWSNSNNALYKMSHTYHHLYTLHHKSEGERVHPRAETTEQVFRRVLQIIRIDSFISALCDQVYSMFRPYPSNPRRSVWQRYVYEQASEKERRDAFWTQLSQTVFHLLFAAFAIWSGRWFLIIVVTLPSFYGGSWYHMLVHDTMHVGKEPETDDFRKSCRTVKLDPFTSFMYWHMEWHTEHHTYAAIPCYHLKKFHLLTREHWDSPQTLIKAWQEMNHHSKRLLSIS